MTDQLGNVNATVLQQFTDRPGQPVYINDVQEATGFDVKRIKTCISNLRQTARLRRGAGEYHPAQDLIDVVKGNAWMYRPNSKPEFSDFEAVGGAVPAARHRVIGVPKIQPAEVIEHAPIRAVARPTGTVFELVGKSDDGTAIVKDEKGKLFRVVAL